MRNKLNAVFLCIALFTLSFIYSESQAKDKMSNEKLFLQHFYDHCYANINSLDKISASSKAFGWKEVEPEKSTLFGKAGKGWLFTDGDLKMLLSINSNKLDGKSINTCTLAASGTDTDKIYKLLEKDFNLSLKEEQKEVYQEIKLYESEQGIITGSTTTSSKDTITLSIVNQKLSISKG